MKCELENSGMERDSKAKKLSAKAAWRTLLEINDLPSEIQLAAFDIDGDPIKITTKLKAAELPNELFPGQFRLFSIADVFRRLFSDEDLNEHSIHVFCLKKSSEQTFDENTTLSQLRYEFAERHIAGRPKSNLQSAILEIQDVASKLTTEYFEISDTPGQDLPYLDQHTLRYAMAVEIIEAISSQLTTDELIDLAESFKVQSFMRRFNGNNPAAA